MNYCSTRNSKLEISSAEAILRGISEDGGLFVPKSFPTIDKNFIDSVCNLGYIECAKRVISLFFTDFLEEEISECVNKAYSGTFDEDEPAQISKLNDNMFIMELWHGPTCAFKDMALQFLPQILVKSSEKCNKDKEIVILTATSGDTGKAALEGFKNVNGVKIGVFYPQNGVSRIQKLQMQTQDGENVFVCGIYGNFDDAQTAVKKIFTDEKVKKILNDNGKMFSSANSINIGRLIPQVAYYVFSYCELVKEKEIENGEKVNFVVPTGNFGNILAAYYAMKIGIPVNKLICASNKNRILTDFINTGVYDMKRDFYQTESPSMDILISSNLERLLFDLVGEDDEYINKTMSNLASDKKYTVSSDVTEKISKLFYPGYCDDENTDKTIKKYHDDYSYDIDTHTSVAVNVYEQYVEKTGDCTKSIVVSTASPYKFPIAVYHAITGNTCNDDFDALEKLEKIINIFVPEQIKNLKDKEVRFTDNVDVSDAKRYVIEKLGGKN